MTDIANLPVQRPLSLDEVRADTKVTTPSITMQTTAPYQPYPHGDSHTAANTNVSPRSEKKKQDHSRKAGAFYSTMAGDISGESDSGSDSFSDVDSEGDDENSSENVRQRNRRRLSMLSAKMRRKRRSTIVDAAELMEL